MKIFGLTISKAAAPAAPNASDGVYVSRPVLNGDAWAKWAQKIGLPNPLDAANLHVTVIASRIGVQKVPDIEIVQVMTAAGCFCCMGVDENVFAVVFDSCSLACRNWDLQAAGAVSEWPMYRPHMSLSMNAPGFTPSQADLASAPQTIILGAETWGPFAPNLDPDGGDADDETEGLVEVELSALRDRLKSGLVDGSLDAYQVATLRSMTLSKRATVSALEPYLSEVSKAKGTKKPRGEYGTRSQAKYADPGYQTDGKPRYPLAKDGKFDEGHIRAAWDYINKPENQTPYSQAELGHIKDAIIAGWKATIDSGGPPSAKSTSKAAAAQILSEVVHDDVVTLETVKTLTLLVRGQNVADTLPEEIRKRLELRQQAQERSVVKALDEDHIAYGWASVSHVNGVEYFDLGGDAITAKAQRQLCHDLIRKTRDSKWEHQGEASNEIVEAIVFDKALQKALGIDLGREGLFVGIHIPDEAGWEKAKSGDWELSIAARCIVEEVADVA